MSKKKKAQKTPVSIETDLNTEMNQQEELTPVKKSHVRHKLHLIPLAAVVFSAAVIIAAVSRDDDDKKKTVPEETKQTPDVTPVQQETPAPEEPAEADTKTAKQKPWIFALFMSAVLIFDELILHQAAGFPFTAASLASIALFSLGYGFLITFLTSFFKKQNSNRIARCVIIALTALYFLVCFFVHKQFKIFYDLSTMTAGASDALGQFQSNVMQLIFSADGMTKIVLYFLPAVLYAIYAKKYDPAEKLPVKTKLITLLTSALMIFGSMGSAYASGTFNTLFSEYNFQNAISSFGLTIATLLDVRKAILPDSMFGFEKEYTKLIHTTSKAGEMKIAWNKNEMEFDWSALAADASANEKSLDAYVASQVSSNKNEYTGLFEGKNLIMLTAEAFSDEMVSEELTPTLYRLLHKGIYFPDYYQPSSAGTTGGEYEIVFGMMPTNGGTSFKNMTDRNNYMTMGSQLNRLGYEGWAFHNNTYTFYDRHLTHNSLGYSHGFMGYGNGMEDYVEWQWPQSDLEMIQGTMPMYENAEHFNVYYMTVSGHNGYDYGSNAMSMKNWDRVQDLEYSDRVKGYYACNLELEDALTYMVGRLEELGIADDTVIVLSADHFPYGLDDGAGLGQMPYLSELYGHNVNDFLDRDHNGLIIWSGCLEDMDPITVDTPVSSIDILPTLSNLFGLEFDSRVFPGRDVFSDAEPLVFTMFYDWKTELGSFNSLTNQFTPAEGAQIPDGYEERIKKIVRNKLNYCTGYNNTDYFNHLFKNR